MTTAAAASARSQLLSPTVAAAAAAATTACLDPWLPAAAVHRQLFGKPLALLQKPGRVRGAQWILRAAAGARTRLGVEYDNRAAQSTGTWWWPVELHTLAILPNRKTQSKMLLFHMDFAKNFARTEIWRVNNSSLLVQYVQVLNDWTILWIGWHIFSVKRCYLSRKWLEPCTLD